MIPVTVVSDVDSVGLHCHGGGSHLATLVWSADSTVVRNWNWLIMNGCESKTLVSPAVGFLNWCQDVKNA
jgi:hypothetical protein